MCFALILLSLLLTRNEAQAQECQDPTDPAYLELMDEAWVAIEAEDYAAALVVLETAYESHQPAVLEYALARAHHHLELFELAENYYNRFLRHFEGCPDPDGLLESARDYRDLAVRQLAAEVPEPEPQIPTPELGVHPGVWVLASGGALIVAGVVFDLSQMGIDDDLADAYQAEDEQRSGELLDRRATARTVDWVLYGAGAAAVLTGTVLLLALEMDAGIAVETGPTAGGWRLSLGADF